MPMAGCKHGLATGVSKILDSVKWHACGAARGQVGEEGAVDVEAADGIHARVVHGGKQEVLGAIAAWHMHTHTRP